MSERALAYVETLRLLLTENEYTVAWGLATLAAPDTDIAETKIADLATLIGRSVRTVRRGIRGLERHAILAQEHCQLGRTVPITRYSFPNLPAGRKTLGTVGERDAKLSSITEARQRHAANLCKRAQETRELAQAIKRHTQATATWHREWRRLLQNDKEQLG